MSRLTSAQSGVPSARQKSKFQGFRRKSWMGTQAQFDEARRWQAAGFYYGPVSRSWREHEPQVYVRSIARRAKRMGEIA